MRVTHNSAIFFARNNSIYQQGDIMKNGEFTIFYDPFRLREVYEDEKSGASTGMIYCEYQFDNNPINSKPVTEKHQAPGGPIGSITPLSLTIAVPDESNSVTIWFRGTRAAYKDSYDSDNGENFNFEVRNAK